MGIPEQIMLLVASLFKGVTINKKMRLDHESLSHPETRIMSSFEYRTTFYLRPSRLSADGVKLLSFSSIEKSYILASLSKPIAI